MRGLEIERLLDFGIRCHQEMDKNKSGNKERKKEIYLKLAPLSLENMNRSITTHMLLTKKLHCAYTSSHVYVVVPQPKLLASNPSHVNSKRNMP